MADQRNGGIPWCDETWNPVVGCSRVSEGCRNCWAERMAHRINHARRSAYEDVVDGYGRWTGQTRLVESALAQPLRWRRPRRIGVCLMGDLFHESVPDEWIDRVFAVMALTPQHTYQVLTKRPERMAEWLLHKDGGADDLDRRCRVQERADDLAQVQGWCHADQATGIWPLPNVWLGTSIEDQATAEARIPHLLRCPAAVRWISAEPLLGLVNLARLAHGAHRMIDCLAGDVMTRPEDEHGEPEVYAAAPGSVSWVVCGGESGTGARPMHPDWARSLRDQCQAAKVPFFMKQMAKREPIPADLMVREFPQLAAAFVRAAGT